MDDLKNAIIHIRDTYGKKVYVAENAYCYTSEDGDGSANSIKGTDDLAEGYSASVQGQANEVRDVCAAASEAVPKASSTGKVPGSRSVPPMLIILPSGKNTAAVGPAVMQAVMIQRMPDSITAEAPGTIRPCSTSPDILWPP